MRRSHYTGISCTTCLLSKCCKKHIACAVHIRYKRHSRVCLSHSNKSFALQHHNFNFILTTCSHTRPSAQPPHRPMSMTAPGCLGEDVDIISVANVVRLVTTHTLDSTGSFFSHTAESASTAIGRSLGWEAAAISKSHHDTHTQLRHIISPQRTNPHFAHNIYPLAGLVRRTTPRYHILLKFPHFFRSEH